MERIYLDNNATTRPSQSVADAVVRAMDVYGNPSSLHAEGRAAARLLSESRRAVAALLGGIFSTLCSAEVACVPLARSTKYIVVDPRIAEQVWGGSKSGDNLATIASKLSSPEAA